MTRRGVEKIQCWSDVPESRHENRWAPHEVALILLGFILPLGETARPAVLAANSTKAPILGIAIIALTFLTIWMTGGRSGSVGPWTRSALAIAVPFTAVTAAATFTRDLPFERYALFAPVPVAVWALWVCERYRVGSFLDVQYRVAVMHVVYAVINGDAVYTGEYEDLSQFSHVFLAFEACLVLILGYSRFRHQSGPRQLLTTVWLAVSAYAFAVAFSRAAFASLVAAVLLRYVMTKPAGERALRVVAVGLATLVTYLWVAPRLLEFLARGDIASLRTATGRTQIWSTVLEHNDAWWRGYGYAALRDEFGPDHLLFLLNRGLTAENALLHTWLVAGFVGVALWLALMWRALKAIWWMRVKEQGLSLSLGAILFVNAVFSIGMSGQPGAYWWLLGMFGFADMQVSGHRASNVGGSVREFPPHPIGHVRSSTTTP